MNEVNLKCLLDSTHINGWVTIYKKNQECADFLYQKYHKYASTDKEIYSLFYCFNNNLDSIPLAYCGKEASFLKYGRGFNSFCKDYNMEGGEKSCPICHEELYKNRNKKAKVTNLEKYGTEISQQSTIVKDKAKETNLQKYGSVSSMTNKEVQEKAKSTLMKNYGVENPSQSSIIREKVKETTFKHFGVECSLQSEEVREKGKLTNIEKYGVEYPSQIPSVKENRKKNAAKK